VCFIWTRELGNELFFTVLTLSWLAVATELPWVGDADKTRYGVRVPTKKTSWFLVRPKSGYLVTMVTAELKLADWVRVANGFFGDQGWTQTVQSTPPLVCQEERDGRPVWLAEGLVTLRVTCLNNGVYREAVGYAAKGGFKSKTCAVNRVYEAASKNALKRVLIMFGCALPPTQVGDGIVRVDEETDDDIEVGPETLSLSAKWVQQVVTTVELEKVVIGKRMNVVALTIDGWQKADWTQSTGKKDRNIGI
jgi:hypothetical protein